MEITPKSLSGRTIIKDGDKEIMIPPYPEIANFKDFTDTKDEVFDAEVKWDGYNVRVLRFNGQILALLRGGRGDPKTLKLLMEHYGPKIESFFNDHPNKILCGEALGKKTAAGYKGFDFQFKVFDIMDLTKPENEMFLDYESKVKLIEEYKLDRVLSIGKYTNKDILIAVMNTQLGKYSEGIEGVVLKSQHYKFKFKYEFNKDVFKEKYDHVPKSELPKPESTRVFEHFMQGYGEPELGLTTGITLDEFNMLQAKLEGISVDDKTKIGVQGNALKDYLLRIIIDKGKFSEEIIEGLKKCIAQYLGKKIGEMIRNEND